MILHLVPWAGPSGSAYARGRLHGPGQTARAPKRSLAEGLSCLLAPNKESILYLLAANKLIWANLGSFQLATTSPSHRPPASVRAAPARTRARAVPWA